MPKDATTDDTTTLQTHIANAESSLRKLAAATGISKSRLGTLSKKTGPDLFGEPAEDLVKIAEALGISTRELLGGELDVPGTAVAAGAAGDSIGTATLDSIRIDEELNPRRDMGKTEIKELAKSIALHGVLEPLIVRPVKDQPDCVSIIAGERRLQALLTLKADGKIKGDYAVPVILRDVGDQEALIIALIENLQREDLTPMDEARGLVRSVTEFKISASKLAGQIGKSKSYVEQRVRIVKRLAPEAVDALEKGTITFAGARLLIKADAKLQAEIIKGIADQEIDPTESGITDMLYGEGIETQHALFERALYEGEIDTIHGVELFLDRAEFWDLQNREIKELQKRLEADDDVAWIDAFRLNKAKDQKEAGSLFYDVEQIRILKQSPSSTAVVGKAIKVDPSGEVIIADAMRQGDVKRARDAHADKRRQQNKKQAEAEANAPGAIKVATYTPTDPATADSGTASAGDAGSAQEKTKPLDRFTADDITITHMEHMRRRQGAALQDAVAANPMHAVRVSCYGLMRSHGVTNITTDPSAVHLRALGETTELKLTNELTELNKATGLNLELDPNGAVAHRCAEHDTQLQGWMDPDQGATLLEALFDMPDHDIMHLHAALVARTVRADPDTRSAGCHPLYQQLAAKLGVAESEARHGLEMTIEDVETGLGKSALIALAHEFELDGLGNAGKPPNKQTIAELKQLVGSVVRNDRVDGFVLPTAKFISQAEAEIELNAMGDTAAEAQKRATEEAEKAKAVKKSAQKQVALSKSEAAVEKTKQAAKAAGLTPA